MHWELNGNVVTAPAVSLYVCGTAADYELNLVVEAGETLEAAYLALRTASGQGLLKAKIEDGNFEEIGTLGQGTCFIGDVSTESSVKVTFRIDLPIGYDDNVYLTSVVVISGDLSALPIIFWTDQPEGYFTDQITDFYV
jgi:hypothetical protein